MEYLNHKFKTIYEDKPTTFKHFKGHLYHIICLCKDSETLEDDVIYENVLTKEKWSRKAKDFFGKVDHSKYPNIKQVNRFEVVNEKDI
jgi:hypothetical protein